MANIEMNYFNGNTYDILYPKGSFNNMSGNLTASQIPNLDASKINSGTLGTSRIPNLSASKITSGVLGIDRIPNLDMSKITTGNLAANRITGLSDQTKVLEWDYFSTSFSTSVSSTWNGGALAKKIIDLKELGIVPENYFACFFSINMTNVQNVTGLNNNSSIGAYLLTNLDFFNSNEQEIGNNLSAFFGTRKNLTGSFGNGLIGPGVYNYKGMFFPYKQVLNNLIIYDNSDGYLIMNNNDNASNIKIQNLTKYVNEHNFMNNFSLYYTLVLRGNSINREAYINGDFYFYGLK